MSQRRWVCALESDALLISLLNLMKVVCLDVIMDILNLARDILLCYIMNADRPITQVSSEHPSSIPLRIFSISSPKATYLLSGIQGIQVPSMAFTISMALTLIHWRTYLVILYSWMARLRTKRTIDISSVVFCSNMLR